MLVNRRHCEEPTWGNFQVSVAASDKTTPQPLTFRFDVTEIDKKVWLLRFADVLIIGAGWIVSVGVFWQIVSGKLALDALSVGILLVALAATVPAWRSMGKIELARWAAYSLAVRLYLTATIIATAAGIVIAYVLRSQELSTSILMQMQTLLGDRTFGYAAFDMLAIGSLIGVYCLSALLAARIGTSGIALRDMLQRFAREAKRKPPRLGRLPVVNRVRSVVAGAGAALLYTFPILPSIGPALLLYARRYAQVAADDLLAIDNRKPILFLRSFVSDLGDDLYAGQTVLGGIALEPRLARHFGPFGPFVAIGDPRDTIPKLGAVRARRGGEDWRATVLEWMTAAQVIVLVAGATPSVLWELGQCIAHDHMAKLIVLFDDPIPWTNDQRLGYVRQAFAGTKWQSGLDAVGPASALRAITFAEDGAVVCVTSSTLHYTEATHLAALIAHDVVLGRANTNSPTGKVSAVHVKAGSARRTLASPFLVRMSGYTHQMFSR